ncbi:MAG: CBS domain-containing protein [Cyclobacteriaceae bacterium]|nr:CBS domain-containing protein [Cyclobacteriaceae bacterium]
MKRRELVSDIMTRDIYKIEVTTPLRKVSEILAKHKIRHLPVVSNDKLLGIISLSDIMRMSFGSNFGEEESDVDEAIFEMLSVKQIMRVNVTTVSPNQKISEAAEILTSNEFHALPVVLGDKLQGIITTTDIIKFLLEEYKESKVGVE